MVPRHLLVANFILGRGILDQYELYVKRPTETHQTSVQYPAIWGTRGERVAGVVVGGGAVGAPGDFILLRREDTPNRKQKLIGTLRFS